MAKKKSRSLPIPWGRRVRIDSTLGEKPRTPTRHQIRCPSTSMYVHLGFTPYLRPCSVKKWAPTLARSWKVVLNKRSRKFLKNFLIFFWSFRGNSSKKFDFRHRSSALARPGSRELRAVKIPASYDPWRPPKRRKNDSEKNRFFDFRKSGFHHFSWILERIGIFQRQNHFPREILLQMHLFWGPCDQKIAKKRFVLRELGLREPPRRLSRGGVPAASC